MDSQTEEVCSANCSPPPSFFGLNWRTSPLLVTAMVLLIPLVGSFFVSIVLRLFGGFLGWCLKKKTAGRRTLIHDVAREQEEQFLANNKKDGTDDDWETVESHSTAGPGSSDKQRQKDWDGIIGFFHPFCNAGGGGERVLWAAIRATQKRWPKAKCVVYTGDKDINKEAMLKRVETRFNIHLHAPTVSFLFLSKRRWVLASTWPRFTLLGQSFGSMILAWDAFKTLVPDIFVDTMGYAFALGLSRFLFPTMPTCAYVHYPTISTDMLESLDPKSPLGSRGLNAGKGVGLRGKAKRLYWTLFAALYARAGSSIDIVMTNSSWTQGHIEKLWTHHRKDRNRTSPIAVVYPPVAVEELEEAIEVSAASERKREKVLIYIAQFRPEKDHQLILEAYAQFVKSKTPASRGAKLVLLGSVRDDGDSKRVYQLRLLANELGIKDSVEFHVNASWPQVLEWLRKAYVGVNGMWNEHFGIGVVEYQAAGLIAVVHDSGGPKLDIVVDIDGQPTGFHANTSTEFAQGFETALSLSDPLAYRLRARQSAKRFTEEEFAGKWTAQMEKLVELAL